MKIRKRWLGIFFAFALVLSLFISLTEVEAAKKKTKTKYLKAKKEEVNLKLANGTTRYRGSEEKMIIFTYKNKKYISIKELSLHLDDTEFKFDVLVGKQEVKILGSKSFSDSDYCGLRLGYEKTVDANFRNIRVKVGKKETKIKVLQSFYYGTNDPLFPLDFFQNNLGFRVRKQKNNLFIGEKVFPKAESYELKLLSNGKREKVTTLHFIGRVYLPLKGLKSLVKDTPSSFGYLFDEEKGYVYVKYYDNEKRIEENLTLSSKNKAKFKGIRVYSGYYGTLETELDYEELEKQKKNVPAEFVWTNSLIVNKEVFLPLDFLCDFMNFGQKIKGKEITFEDKKRENFRVLKGVSGGGNECGPWGGYFAFSYEEDGRFVSLQAESHLEKEKEAFVTVQWYNPDFSLQTEKKILLEGERFGGFFRGSVYNFILFGNNNEENSDAKVTYHLVKYDKEFNRLGSLEIRGAFTTYPFSMGTVRMAESGDSLIIHTAKLRYDGHQSQMTFIVSISSMSLMNADDIGEFQQNHVGHSFDQRVEIDENQNVYLLDHGDAYPRSLVLRKMGIEGGKLVYRIGNRWGGGNRFHLLKFPGEIGANLTGFQLGSMVQGDKNLLIGGSHIDYSKVTAIIIDTFHTILGEDVDKMDAFFFVVNKEDPNIINKIRLTNYALDGTDISYSPPRILKINEEKYLILWNKVKKKDWEISKSLCYQYVNQDGSFLTERKEIEGMEMTKMEPILMDGKVLWTKVVTATRDHNESHTSKILFILPVE